MLCAAFVVNASGTLLGRIPFVTNTQTAPYGSWKSPVTSDLIVTGSIGLGRIVIDGDDIYWLEMRPAEDGRYVIVRRTPDGSTADVIPAPFNARTRVHEYGGGSFTVVDGTVYFSNFTDQRVYRRVPGGQAEPLTPDDDYCYADFTSDRYRNRLICVREDHTSGDREAINTLVSIDPAGGDAGRLLVAGNDFYSTPRLSPDGARLAWLTWNHPNMPWDGTELWVADILPDGSVENGVQVAGGADESVFQPEWSPDGFLYFVSDRTGWWNIYRQQAGSIERLCEMDAEFGMPQWIFGMRTYAFDPAGTLVCTYARQGRWHLARIDTATKHLEPVDTLYSEITYIQAAAGSVTFLGGSPTEPRSIVHLDLDSGTTVVLRRSSDVIIDAGSFSIPEHIEFPTEHGQTAHAFFYPPRNRDYTGPSNELPPLVVKTHGGPTAATSATFSLSIQFWTSRGVAVVDVDYGGSTGYGREYRERLNGRWGVVDVDDCANAARYLVERALVDSSRMAITGGSAGGYTTLCALTFRDVFSAGASHYGVSDPAALAEDTHKFESRYLDCLIGPYPAERDLYRQRAPIHFADRLSCPVIFFQGLEDKIVPPNQAETMVEALRSKGVPVAYVPFEGEQHGFRRADNIKRALDAELYFYSVIFGFETADEIEPVTIYNL